MRNRRLLLSTSVCLLAIAALAADWPQWRGPNRDDISKETGLLKSWPDGGPKLLWTFEDAGVGFAGYSIVGDRLYTLGAFGSAEKLFALDVNTGKKFWELDVGPVLTNGWGDGPRGTPTVDGDRVYALSGRGRLVCADAAQGAQAWAVELTKDLGGSVPNWGYTESPLVDGDVVICTPGGKQGTLAALDKKTGKAIWRSKEYTSGAHYSSPVVAELAGIKQYVQLTRSGVFGVAAADGKLLWQSPLGGAGTAAIPTPIVHDDHVFVTSGYRDSVCGVLKLTPKNGGVNAEVVWKGTQLINKHGGVLLLDGMLYGNQQGRPSWAAVDFKSGKKLGWDAPKLGPGSITYADGRLYLYEEGKGVCVLLEPNPKEWKEAGRFTIPKETKVKRKSGKIWTHPVVANGRLYLRDQDLIFCYDVKDSATGAER